ncbi:hypothetical protein KR222_002132, partial [Zaprionus bogoriensis]
LSASMEKTLLKKYDIPLSHLDFAYIETCENAREMERIVKILRSGEEGFYPDLTRCAEEKLKKLKPDSKLFRVEEPISSTRFLDKQELKPIYDWTNDIKSKDSQLNELKQETPADTEDGLPPIRTPSKIDMAMQQAADGKAKPGEAQLNTSAMSKTKANEQRIKSTDYGKWDKYDPDEEILRMDLEEERTKEQAQAKGRQIEKMSQQEHIKICEQEAEKLRLNAQLKRLSQMEREQYAEKYRIRGNEYFKAKEYDNALKEYDRAIVYDPEQAARSYNNRAVTNIKLKNYLAAIEDCEACLQLEPDNVKALFRLAEANYAQGRHLQSYGIYQRVLDLEPDNVSALKSLDLLRSQLGELAPAHATRMAIEEHKTQEKEEEKITTKPKPKPKTQPVPVKPIKPPKEYDLAELIKPNRVVKSKIVSAAEALGGKIKGGTQNDNSKGQPLLPMMQGMSPNPNQPIMRLPQNNKVQSNKLLIQEL